MPYKLKLAKITPVYNYNNSANKRGESAIHIRVYYGSKRKLVGTGTHLRPEQWDAKRNKVKNHPAKESFNIRIKNELRRIEDNEQWYIARRRKYSVTDLIADRKLNQEYQSFSQFIKLDLAKRTDLSPGTIRNHQGFINRLAEFKSFIAFDDVNYSFLNNFEIFLRGYSFTKGGITKRLELTRVVKYLKTLNTYVKRAIKD